MKKGFLLLSTFLIFMGGCGKKTQKTKKRQTKTDVFSQVDIPIADDGIRSFFDEEIGEFTFADDGVVADNPQEDDALNYSIDLGDDLKKESDFSWTEEQMQEDALFKTVYFDFNEYKLKPEQEDIVESNIVLAKKMMKEAHGYGSCPTIIIEGHACHSAGSAVYNLALSEKRAKVLSDRFIAAGISKENIKIVGRGTEVPAIIDGRTVSGDRLEQWPNRRDEVRLIYR